MEKNEVKTTLRYPYRFKEEVKRIAEEEGMSENSVLVQGLAWWLKYREKMRNALSKNNEAPTAGTGEASTSTNLIGKY